jgi:hypothetical protein
VRLDEQRVNPLLNDTKWEELRVAMYALDSLSPQWRTRDVENGHVSTWDGDWYYHFRLGAYRSIEWVEIKITTREQDAAVLAALSTIHLPGHRIESGFRVYGYSRGHLALDYL